MQIIQSSYKSLGHVAALGGSRIFVPLAVVISLAVAAAVGLEVTATQYPASNGFF
ncbi:MAG: hypothetical protein WBH04_00685 [Albidovulum sp.]|jgi:hypothetical protein